MIGGKLAMEDLCLLARSLACDVRTKLTWASHILEEHIM
jgi:hypothetical protein